MGLIASGIRTVERTPLPDPITRFGIDFLVGKTRRRLAATQQANERSFADGMIHYPIAEHTAAANEQHYELPPAFFELVLGPRRKYSCCLYEDGAQDLAAAEVRALEETAAHADLADGQRILELGCGWGSLSLFMAERYPNATITAVSNSKPQRLHIEAQAAARGLGNLTIVTADMNVFSPETGPFDRVVSVEMFEHMANWSGLLERVRSWLKPDGKLFLHVFTHRSHPYRFDHRDETDWIGQYFFTGGIMPSHGLIRHFPDWFTVDAEWKWNGKHYARTANDWLKNFDANRPAIDALLREVYKADFRIWRRRWRLFFLATAGLFGHGDGQDWTVSHYRLSPVPVHQGS